MSRIPVAVLGATGAVGQRIVALLADHPWFEVAAVAASGRSAGRRYADVVAWRQRVPMPPRVADLVVRLIEPPIDAPIVFSALDAAVAGEAEQAFARADHLVVSNSKNHRMDPDVPLLLPEVNADHLALIGRQRRARRWRGAIVTNSNCSTMFLAMAAGPLHRAFGIERISVVTMQAVSGAGYPGLPSLDIIANVIPFIEGEEEKIERETRKILGTVADGTVTDAPIRISAQTNRVPVEDGHTESVSLALCSRTSLDDVRKVLEEFRGPVSVARLPSAPVRPIIVLSERDRPQPRFDVERERGMVTFVGRLRPCPVFDYKFTVLGHNTVRGAAGAAILNAELLKAEGYLD